MLNLTLLITDTSGEVHFTKREVLKINVVPSIPVQVSFNVIGW